MAEKLSEVENLDAYVFLDAKNYVDSDFLSNVNYYLSKYDVFMPIVNYIGEYKDLKFWDCVRVTYSSYVSKFIYATRTRLGLTNLINTDNFVIKKELLNKIGSFDFQDKTAEVLYTLKLAKEKVAVASIDDLKVYTEIGNYDNRIPSLSKRINIFRTGIACHDYYRIPEIYRVPQIILKFAFFKKLQKKIKNIWMRFFNFI